MTIGPHKGASFERDTCKALSTWISKGTRIDLFNRNVLSGGRFTIAQSRNIQGWTAGDVAASHPLSHEFLTYFIVECKHHADLHLEQLMYATLEKSYIGVIIKKAQEQASVGNKRYLLVAKQNRIGTLLFTDGDTGRLLLNSSVQLKNGAFLLGYHVLYSGLVYVFQFDNVLIHVNPTLLVERAKG